MPSSQILSYFEHAMLETFYKIAVLGSASDSEDSADGRKAFRIGKAIAARGGVLLTGSCQGFPHAAVKGARSAGGFTVGISPAMNLSDHSMNYAYPADSSAIIYTGMGKKGRNVVLVRSADACIFVGGGMGTLNEFTIAFDELNESCAIGILSGSGGYSEEFSRLAALCGRQPRALLVDDPDPESLVEQVFLHISHNSSR